MRDGFIFYGSFWKAVDLLEDDDRLAAYDMICRYALTGELPEDARGAGYAIFLMAKPQIDANEKRRNNGMKGGRPKAEKKQEETEGKPKGNLKETDGKPKEKEKYKEKEKEKSKREKSSFGEYGNVRLTDAEHEKLVTEFGEEQTRRAVRFLDEYIAEKGYKSKSHYLALRRWVFDAVREKRPQKQNRFQNFPGRSGSEKEQNDNMMAKIIAMGG